GQVVGSGIIADMSRYFTHVIEVNTDEKWVRVEPGVIPDELNKILQKEGLLFGPETSTSNRCNIGGMIGNNSCGLHSVIYGSVRDHIIEVKALLADGSEVVFGPLSADELKEKCTVKGPEGDIYREISNMMEDAGNRDSIMRDYPERNIPRRNTAYALDDLLFSESFVAGSGHSLNLARLITGSEGTLAIVTEAKLALVPLPPKIKALLCIHLKHRDEAFRANLIALKYNPWAVEMIDSRILSLAEQSSGQRSNRFFIEGDPGALLITELCAVRAEDIMSSAAAMEREMRAEELGYAFPMVWGDDIKRVWDLRKAGLGILSNMPGDARPVTLIEDCAVAVDRLGAFVAEVEKMLESHGKDSVFHAHIGSGELHIRPVLNLKDKEDAKLLRVIGMETAHIVKRYRGSISGEHGDGRLRGEFIPIIIGEHNYLLNKRLKNCFDPLNILNPGKIVNTPPMDTSLRYVPGRITPDLRTWYDFTAEGGVIRAAEKCNGSGDCRKSSIIGGTMCPSYMATFDERLTTRARANIVREMLNEVKPDPWDSREMMEILDLCLACKGCKRECPSGVDMAKLKSEFLQHYNDRHSPSLRIRLIANLPKINTFFSPFPGLFNYFASNRYTAHLIKLITGFATQRSIPVLAPMTLTRWTRRNLDQLNPAIPSGSLYLFIDEFTNHNDTGVGIAAIKLLTALGYKVLTVRHAPSARTLISKGFLRKARKMIIRNIEIFSPLVTDRIPLVGLEPSAILGFRDEFPELAGENHKQDAMQLAKNTFLLEEFLVRERDAGKIGGNMFKSETAEVMVHVHCQQKAIATSSATLEALSIPVGYNVREISSGCCGMAGAFGYEKEHFDLSMKIGEMVLFPEVRKAVEKTIVVAPGTSCRHHIKDGTGRAALHPAEVLWNAVKGESAS
ncbi:MAG: FAD-binding oxidoreductase, partial [Bacteroidia bacterium]